jgi:ribosomal protein S18 acetylase RimI-like enzyme
MPEAERRRMGENGCRTALRSFGRTALIKEIEQVLLSLPPRRTSPLPPRRTEVAYRFYSWDSENTVEPAGGLPPGYSWALWKPAWTRVRPPGQPLFPSALWWLAHHFRLLANRDYAALVVSYEGRVVHRSCVYPRGLQFPPMGGDDLQIGDLWTDEAHRGKGLATFAVTHILSNLKKAGRRFWYIVPEDNRPAVRIAEGAKGTLRGAGRKIPRLGLEVFTKFILDRPISG